VKPVQRPDASHVPSLLDELTSMSTVAERDHPCTLTRSGVLSELAATDSRNTEARLAIATAETSFGRPPSSLGRLRLRLPAGP
jgi:hypothetical protein